MIKLGSIDISGAEPLRACVILLSAFRGAFLEEGCNYKKALERLFMQAEKERKLPPQHPAATDDCGAPKYTCCLVTLLLHQSFFSFFECALSQVRV